LPWGELPAPGGLHRADLPATRRPCCSRELAEILDSSGPSADQWQFTTEKPEQGRFPLWRFFAASRQACLREPLGAAAWAPEAVANLGDAPASWRPSQTAIYFGTDSLESSWLRARRTTLLPGLAGVPIKQLIAAVTLTISPTRSELNGKLCRAPTFAFPSSIGSSPFFGLH